MADNYVIPAVSYEEYSKRFEKFFELDRTPEGIITAKLRNPVTGESPLWCKSTHRAIWQFLRFVGQDPEAEVLIFGGVGDTWIAKMGDPDGSNDSHTRESTIEGRLEGTFDHMYYDGPKINEAFAMLDIPTIGVLNGPGFHFEMQLLCDICLMAEEASVVDTHFFNNIVPGDGIQLAIRHRIGTTRANYMMLTHMVCDSSKALEWGLADEVLPRKDIYARAMELAKDMMKQGKVTRRATVDLLRRKLREEIATEGRIAFGHEMWSYMYASASHAEMGIRQKEMLKAMGCNL